MSIRISGDQRPLKRNGYFSMVKVMYKTQILVLASILWFSVIFWICFNYSRIFPVMMTILNQLSGQSRCLIGKFNLPPVYLMSGSICYLFF